MKKELNYLNMISLIDVKTDNTTDYKKTSLYLVTSKCSGKCGERCHNYRLMKEGKAEQFHIKNIVDLYNKLYTHNAVVIAGLEPFDTYLETYALVSALFESNKPVDVVIYTGYDETNKNNFYTMIDELKKLIIKPEDSLIIKQGPYKPDDYPVSWPSQILGVELATSNQKVRKTDINEPSWIVESLV